MANHKSALKRHRQSEKARLHHRSVRSKVSTLIKKVLGASNKEEAVSSLQEATSSVHKAVKKGILHKNTGNRRISRLARHVNGLSS